MMDHPELPRYELATTRRRFLTRAAALGAAVALPGALAACGSDDEAALSDDSPATTSADASASTTTASDGTTTAVGATDPSTTAPDSTVAGSAGGTLPAGATLDVAFTYTAGSSDRGPARNPYLAVWVEDADGALVSTLSVWYNPPKGERWINELTSWYSAASGTDIDAVTGATRPAGTYTVSWDGTDEDGARVATGDYVVFVESAREHGPHSVTSASLRLDASAASVDLDDAGELSALTATYSV